MNSYEKDFSKRLQTRIAGKQAMLDKFKTDFEQNPVHALEWSEEVFYAAAYIMEGHRVLNSSHTSFKPIHDIMQNEVNSMALSTGSSSSFSSNAMTKARLAAKARIIDDMRMEGVVQSSA
jgi:hypothetical protein